MRYLVLAIVIIASITSRAQQSMAYQSDIARYQEAVQLFEKHQYQAAKSLFEEVKSSQNKTIESNAAYYLANTAVRLEDPSAQEAITSFVENYPTSPKKNQAFSDVADYYFDSGNYREAKQWFKKVNTSRFTRDQKEKFQFKYGYTLYKTNNFDKAKAYLEKLRTSADYGADAKYYLGYMAYKEDRYEEASSNFEEAQQQGSTKELSYFLSDMNFKLGNFEKAIELGLQKLDKSNRNETSQLNKIIGESYFNLQQYKEAIPYLQNYQGERGKWNNTDYYQLGYAYFKQNDFEKAISEFNKIINEETAVSQNAYYHLAQSYIKTDQKPQALNAFKSAMEMDFDKNIQQDAFLNYAKLSYDIGNSYESVPVVLTTYLASYPNSPESSEINALLVDSYLTSKNYKEAIDLLENRKDYQDKLIWQKANYLYALDFFEAFDYANAILYFDVSASKPLDKNIIADATYWKAESNFNLGNYEEALLGFKSFKGMSSAKKSQQYEHIDYDIGYAYFKIKDYDKAKIHFELASKAALNSEQQYDALVRLGDTYYVTNDYWNAMEQYNKALGMPGYSKDYVAYQKAVSYGYVDNNETKLEELKDYVSTYQSSVYLDDAYYQLGNTYIAENKIDKGLEAYQKLMKVRPQSPFIPKALSKIGLTYYNTNEYEKALGNLKRLVAEFPATEEAQQAVQTVRLIYVDQQKPQAYASWVKGLDFVSVTDSEIENTTYEAAENKFIERNTTAAIRGFENYLKEFPEGVYALKSHFYLAELYYNNGDFDKCIPNYEAVASAPKSEYTEESLRKLSQLYLEDANYEKAIQTLSSLEIEASFTENKTFAQSNLMKANYQMENYQEAIDYANIVLAIQGIDENIKSDAYIFTARAAVQTNNMEVAKTAYANVETIADGKQMAEALYYKAYFLNADGNFEDSNNIIQNELAKNYSRFREFGVKGLVVMAKNYYALGDAFQATYILESVVKNYTSDYPEIAEQAQQELEIIKAQEAETNSSVEKP